MRRRRQRVAFSRMYHSLAARRCPCGRAPSGRRGDAGSLRFFDRRGLRSPIKIDQANSKVHKYNETATKANVEMCFDGSSQPSSVALDSRRFSFWNRFRAELCALHKSGDRSSPASESASIILRKTINWNAKHGRLQKTCGSGSRACVRASGHSSQARRGEKL